MWLCIVWFLTFILVVPPLVLWTAHVEHKERLEKEKVASQKLSEKEMGHDDNGR